MCSTLIVEETCVLNLYSENVDFERFFAPKRFFGNHSNKCVVFDKFLLIRQNHNFVSKVKIDCEWNAQMHLLSNGKLVEMETLSPVYEIRVLYIHGQQTKALFKVHML